MTENINDKLKAWAKTYGINEEALLRMHTTETSLATGYHNPQLVDIILKTNSALLQQFLASLHRPEKQRELVGIQIDYLFPTPTAYQKLFERMLHPRFAFERMDDELATMYWDADGTQFYAGPTKRSEDEHVNLVLPTYVQTVGRWEKGYYAVIHEMEKMRERGFFVYSMAIGICNDHRQTPTALTHTNVGVGGCELSYFCSHQHYDPSSFIGEEHLDTFWNDEQVKQIKAQLRELNARFYKKEEKTLEPITRAEIGSMLCGLFTRSIPE